MSLLWIEGFEMYGPRVEFVDFPTDSADIFTQRWTGGSNTPEPYGSLIVRPGRTANGKALEVGTGLDNTAEFFTSWNFGEQVPGIGNAVLGGILGWGYATRNVFDIDFKMIDFIFWDGGSDEVQWTIWCEASTRKLFLRIKGGPKIYMGTTILNSGVDEWQYLEFKWELVSNLVRFTLRKDEIETYQSSWLSSVGIDGGIAKIALWSGERDTIAVRTFYDDMYMINIDGQGVHNDFLGKVTAMFIEPAADTAYSTWVGNDGGLDNYEHVNEYPVENDTYLTEPGPSGSSELFDMTTLSPTNTILGIEFRFWAKAPAGQEGTICPEHLIDGGPTVRFYDNIDIDGTAYRWYTQVQDTDEQRNTEFSTAVMNGDSWGWVDRTGL